MPTKIVISVGNGVGRDYANIAAAFAGTECVNRVANDDYVIIEVYNDNNLAVISSGTELVIGSATNTVTIQPAYGHDYSATDFSSTPLKYDPSLGATLETTSSFGILLHVATDAYLTVNNMQLKCADSNGRISYTGDGNMVFNDCLINENGQGDATAPDYNNCLLIRDANLSSPVASLNYANANQCTMVVPADLTHTGDLVGLIGSATVNECAGFGGGSAFSNAAQANSDYNASDDATGPGANSLDNLVYADQFENVNNATQDWRRKSGNDLDGAGLAGIDIGYTIPPAIPAPNPNITNIDTDNIINSDQTNVAINGTVLDGVTLVTLNSGPLQVTQTIQGTPTATQILFDVVQGLLPYGSLITEITAGAYIGAANITLNPPAANQYVGVVNPGTDVTTVFYNATTTPQTGDQLEWATLSGNSQTVTIQPNGTFSIAGGTGTDTIQVRWRESATDTWGAWTTLTVNSGTINQAPIVTPPSTLNIEIPNGAAGLAKNDSALVAWLAAATVDDDVTSGLTTSGDVSGLTDPVPVGNHSITFTSTADAGGLTGNATAFLVITEAAAPNEAPVVTAPADITIEFPFATAGLPKNNAGLVAWLALVTLTDDYDPNTFTITNTVTPMADPIPAGVYTVTFTSSADSGGLVGNDTAILTIAEATAPNEAPVVTPPANIAIEFPNDDPGLPKNDATLLAWIASATAVDDTDNGLTVSADLSSIADPIPAAIYTITFTSSADSEGLTGNATALLTVTEASPTLPTITAPVGRVMSLDQGFERFVQDPQAVLDYWMPWGDLIGADRIDTVNVAVDTGLILGANGVFDTTVTDDEGVIHAENTVVHVWLSGGTPGTEYNITVTIATVDGRTDERSFSIYCTQL